MKRFFCLLMVIFSVFSLFGCGNDASQEDDAGKLPQPTGGIEKEIPFAESFFYKQKSDVKANYPESFESGSNLLIRGTFAGMKGAYYLYTDKGKIYKVIFQRDESLTIKDTVISKISAFMGEHGEYNKEWESYTWIKGGLKLKVYLNERIYFEPTYEDDSKESNDDNNSSGKLTDGEIKTLVIQTLAKELAAYENRYGIIDDSSCRYSINKIQRDDGMVEVYGTVYFYDKYGSPTSFGGKYSSGFTIHMTEWGGSNPWCEMN